MTTKEIEIQVNIYSDKSKPKQTISFRLKMKVQRDFNRHIIAENIHSAIKSRLDAKDIEPDFPLKYFY